MFDCVKTDDRNGKNRFATEYEAGEGSPDTPEKSDHRISIHVTGLLVLLFLRKYFPLRPA